VVDIFGKVESPYYTIKLMPEQEPKEWGQASGTSLFAVEGCRILTQDDIRSIREKSTAQREGEVDASSEESEGEGCFK
jgi:rRNA processing protein Gar1